MESKSNSWIIPLILEILGIVLILVWFSYIFYVYIPTSPVLPEGWTNTWINVIMYYVPAIVAFLLVIIGGAFSPVFSLIGLAMFGAGYLVISMTSMYEGVDVMPYKHIFYGGGVLLILIGAVISIIIQGHKESVDMKRKDQEAAIKTANKEAENNKKVEDYRRTRHISGNVDVEAYGDVHEIQSVINKYDVDLIVCRSNGAVIKRGRNVQGLMRLAMEESTAVVNGKILTVSVKFDILDTYVAEFFKGELMH